MEVSLGAGQTKENVQEAFASFEATPPLGNIALSTTQEGNVLIRMRSISNDEHLVLLQHLQTQIGDFQEQQYTTIGPTVGASMKQRAFWALTIACIAIVVYIAFAFRKIPRRLSPWRFGVIAVITLVHDVLITTGISVVLSHVTSFEIDTLFITALLTILGYSVNDTIIIFDRIRDNVALQDRNESFAMVADRSLSQSITRSLNTSGSTLIMLFSLILFGSESIRWFVFTLFIGIMIGSYSSIFLAVPLLVYWKKKE